MYVNVLEFVELTEKTESAKPHPLSKFSRSDVDTPPLPVRNSVNEELMDQKKENHWQVHDNYHICMIFCISS